MATSKARNKAPAPFCTGSPSFDPSKRTADQAALATALAHLDQDDLRAAVTSYFQLPQDDGYVYHAITSVTLAQAQDAVRAGPADGQHAWYRASPLSDAELAAAEPDLQVLVRSLPLPAPPPRPDIEAYVAVFSPATSTPAALKSLAANARKASIRSSVASHLAAKRFVHPAAADRLAVPRAKPASTPQNPYFDFWAWSCRALSWAGPSGATSVTAASPAARRGHPVLPVLMHHFGCAVPSHEALVVLRTLAAGRSVLDVGSGCGYWAFMLRSYGVQCVPVDSGQSVWRVSWVRDTTVADGARWLRRREQAGGRDAVLLLVYPIVGGGVAGGEEGGFTRGLLDAYEGDTIAVVGTQNGNGYTGFRDATMDQYMSKERLEWTRVVQIPLPSFAGKDEALFIFQRGERAPPRLAETSSGNGEGT